MDSGSDAGAEGARQGGTRAAARADPAGAGLSHWRDLGLAGDINFDFAVAADFDDLAGYLAYRENAEHRKIVETFIQPIVGARGAVQYEI